MIDHELLLGLTESYLKSLISEAAGSLHPDFDSFAAFGELGINSFQVLKIIKRLEADFGTLPKSLLFENFNINDLARYFVTKHEATLARQFAAQLQKAPAAVHAAAPQAPAVAVIEAPQPARRAAAPLLIREKDAYADPELKDQVRALFDRYKIEGSVSRGTRKIAPNLFIGASREGYFHCSRGKDILLVYAYTGPLEYLPVALEEIYRYSVEKGLQLNILAGEEVPPIAGVAFSATPFGVLQRAGNLKEFTLDGGAMRRLRYQVQKFQKAGQCRTEEYRIGANRETDQEIVRIIDRWCESRTVVNPLVHEVRAEILDGALTGEHRLFLTYLDDVLQNAILITPMCEEANGYLMDLEFYPPEMPLGGLEFAIVEIIRVLVSEGRDLLSLGGTYGCRLEASASADPGVERVLDELRDQNIFNDAGNLQFKNKFRPDNRSIFLCRPVGSAHPENVLDIIMMIADPDRMQVPVDEPRPVVVEAAPAPVPVIETAPVIERVPVIETVPVIPTAPVLEGNDRARVLAAHGFNPLNVPHEHIEIDLKTDSWAQLEMPAIDAQMRQLYGKLQQPVDVDDSIRSVFPFAHAVLTASGQAAEHLFFSAFAKRGVVLQNLLFPSTIFHQIDKGFTPRELPHPALFQLQSHEPYKGDADWNALQAQLAHDPAAIAMVCIEVGNNAAGGAPVSIAFLRKVKALLAPHSIPLVLDATRVVENARMLVELEKEYAGRSVWAVVRDILSCADAVIGSLTKDFCVNKGGIVATNDARLHQRLQELVREQGADLDLVDQKAIALSLQNRKGIEAKVLRRMENVRLLWHALTEHSVPVVRPAGGHCILIDVKQLPEFKAFADPVASFLGWLYVNTGIRAAAHNVGMQKQTPLNDVVRLAVPVGLKTDEAAAIVERLAAAFDRRVNIPEIVLESHVPQPFGGVHANYRLVRYHNVAQKAAPVAPPVIESPVIENNVPAESGEAVAQTPVPSEKPRRMREVAIVGMAGRYPKAKNVRELWQNLAQGRDCIEEIPAERYERRIQYGAIDKYRGGFIDDVDKFDSLFFHISPREAEMLDPQERLFLEVAWEVMEDAGYYPELLAQDDASRNIGVYVGAVWALYQILGAEEKHLGNKAVPNSFLWSIANRVSYALNLSGPSLTVDTACSSSLTALYLACEAIQAGDCSGAIVGGVNLDLHQTKFEINHQGGALSPDGYCRTFGKGANGYVQGEGVGALFLKPLDQAVRDGDHIYGVIKSAVVNHGGRTSGYTVPNPKAQADLVVTALAKANVDARTIGYVEAHGTGTELGDPVEITGLNNAFHAYAPDNHSCAIGSVKTNIGHLEAAAGVVSVSKVLLQMQHRQIAPSLHSAELNEFIDFEHSPFYVAQKLEPWQPREMDGVRQPLRAGISSFGAGGANAHVIIESYERPAVEESPVTTPLIFPISARTEDQLRPAAARLAEFLGDHEVSLADAAYTLQQGRKSFEYRVAVIAATKDELLQKLALFVDGKKHQDVIAGHAKNGEGVTRLLSRREKQEFLRLVSQGADAQKIAGMWAEGLLADWQGHQSAGKRIPLPTYPFADKRHWAASAAPARRAFQPAAGVHPMIDANESTFERQIFKKAFHDRDFFIYDHLVSDIPTLPGVAYLEFARKAGELAAGRKVQKIRNILWISPIAVQGSMPKEVCIELKPSGENVQFEVFSEGPSGRTPHSQGKLLYATSQEVAAEPEYIDLAAIRARCEKVIDGNTAYPLFKSFGLNLGPSFQVLGDVYKNENETLGALRLPELRQNDLGNLILHPSLVDGSLQAGVAAQLGSQAGEMYVPFSIGEVEVLYPLPPVCFSYVTKGSHDERRGKGSGVLKSNVLIVDESGKVLVRIRESVGVPLREVHEKPAQHADNDGFAPLYYSYDWEDAPLAAHDAPAAGRTVLFAADDALRAVAGEVVVVRAGDAFAKSGDGTYTIDPRNKSEYTRLFQSLLDAGFAFENVCFAWPLSDASLEQGVYALLYVTQALMELKLESKVQLLYVFANDGEALPEHESVTGFVSSLRLESPRLLCKTIEVRRQPVVDAVAAELRARIQDANAVRYDAGQRSIRKLKSFELESVPEAAQLRENGVYVITGGAGGLGLLFAEFLAKEYKARLVLTGRSALTPEREAKLDEFRNAGAKVLYVPADVANHDDVARLLDATRAQFGAIHGVIHAAGVLRDSLIRNKTADEMRAVFAPKIDGTRHLDELTKDDALDFFAAFSSLAAVAGNAGQCDYSFANHYMDSFLAARERQRAAGLRSGKAISFNWSLWAEGGMRLDEQTEAAFRKTLGIAPLRTELGLDVFVRGLASGRTQFAFLEGVQEKIETAWGLRKKAVPAAAPAANAAATAGGADEAKLQASLQNDLSKIAMEFLKLDASDISPDKILLDLGFDSIGLTTYANAINDKFGLDITPVLFFDYPSINEIAKNLAEERKEELQRHYGTPATPSASQTPAPQSTVEKAPVFEIRKGWDPAALDRSTPAAASSGGFAPELRFINEPIAVVGMAGVMPQSEDVDEFWENLRTSTNMVSVIPEDRWKWEDFYGDPVKEFNKSNSKWGGFMKEVDKFDPLFFGISPREAQMMDPQQRIFLETVWKAVEDSGQKVSDLSGSRTGLFVGVATNDYADVMHERGVALDGYTASGNSHSVLANRVSFLLNLHGPSAPIDTACSSSLVALHRAIESIHTRSCDMAIVGGVQVMLSPAAYISFGAAGMLSSDGKCKTFDKGANGYVRGEGGGAVLLKRLSDAERDGNHIYAIIKSTAENHGGKVTTLTAPNSAAQTELLVEAYEKAQVDPATVGYIECHGTGTPLGDPIEIQALTKAFAELYKKRNKAPRAAHCGLSSVKTNIGHLETAAGIAGLLKALLAIQYKQIPANIHFEEVNPYINLKGTPFYIADKLTPWEPPVGEDGTPGPRRAGLSSFGFGGANAHIVLEEYIAAQRQTPDEAHDPQLIVLSAKNAERVDAYVRSLRSWFDRHDVELIDLAYTLQVGRDEMPERLAIVAHDLDDLKQKLDAILRGETPADTYRNNTRTAGEPVAQNVLQNRELSTVAQLWIAGAKVEWRALYKSALPRRIAAPTYPFARERYWIPASASHAGAPRVEATAALHPLVHRNTSTLQEQKFASRFSGNEFFLADHVVETNRILPGVAYIEMARAAGELSGNARVRAVRNVTFERPLLVGDGGKDVEVALVPAQNEVRFAIRSGAGDDAVTHCSGKIDYAASPVETEFVDVDAIRARCAEEVLSGDRLYPALNEGGLKLGRSFRNVQSIGATESEALAVLQLPEHLQEEVGQFCLHPALMDASLHTAMGLVTACGMEVSLALPYSISEVQVFHPLADLHYAYATWAETPKPGQSIRKVNFELLDKSGKVLARIKEFVSRELQPAATKAAVQAAEERLESFVPAWKAVRPESRVTLSESSNVILIGDDQAHLAWLRTSYLNSRLVDVEDLGDFYFEQLLWIAPDAQPERIVEQQEDGVMAVFRIVKTLLRLGYANKMLQWTLIVRNAQRVGDDDAVQPAHAGVVGLIGSVAKEYPQWDLRVLDVESLGSVTARECLALPYDKQGNVLARRGEQWFQQELAPATIASDATPLYRQNGVYVVIGGAGGIGEVWSRFMIENYQAQVVWIGRRERDAAIDQKIAALAEIGPAPLYIAADATDVNALVEAAKSIRALHPAIHGVVHSAIVLQDRSIARMEEETFRGSLAAKVDVSVAMDAVFGAEELDFVLFFSSIISFFKTPGQSNYAAGCTFKDSFAHALQQRRPYPVKIMNWGYWGTVGVAAGESHKKALAKVGLGSIEPHEGMAALRQLLASGANQLALIKTIPTDVKPMNDVPAKPSQPAAPAARPAAAAVNDQRITEHVRRLIIEKMSESVQIDASRIGRDTPFAEFGVDSIAGIRFLRLINEALQIELEATSLFEYATVDQLTGYVVKNWSSSIGAQIAPAEAASAPIVEKRITEKPAAPVAVAPRFASMDRPVEHIVDASSIAESGLRVEPIAIVGMSGRFANSESLDEFWQNLAAGKHLVDGVTRWSASDCVMSQSSHRPYCSHGSFIDSIDRFDPAFFGITPDEAVYMDPQQRLFLEESWKALEDAGYAGKAAQDKQCGVYVGCGSSNYDNLMMEEPPEQAFWGNSQAVIPARIAYYLDLHGPAIAVDTVCSSSLVAIHLACQGLWARETEMALAGGVFLQATPEFYQVANQAGMLSPAGSCRSFDGKADGFVPGEGVGVVVLKRLSDAMRDGDVIHGVIAGTGINQDGRSNGFIAPNGRAQERLERGVYERFGIDPSTIQIVEAHATGSVLGDSIEYGALTRAFRDFTDKTQFCALGTVKTNIGHAAAAAGVASLLKLLLSLKHRQLAPSLHFENGNPAIDFNSGPFYVNTSLKDWTVEDGAVRRGAINSFGFSGTNAHLVVEEPPAHEQSTDVAPAHLVVLSARSAEQLKLQVVRLLSALEKSSGLSMTDLGYTLFSGRAHLTHRFACVARNQEELMHQLMQWLEAGVSTHVYTSAIPEGRVREQAALKKFGNYCIRECLGTADAGTYVENLAAVAELYVQGYALDYEQLFAAGAKRMALPVYPFADERYWIDADGGAVTSRPSTVSAAVVSTSSLPAFTGADDSLLGWLENDLSQIAREILAADDADLALDKVLLDLGFDSLGLTKFAGAINDKYQVALTPVLFFDHPSLGALAKYLSEEREGEVKRVYESASPAARTIAARPAAPRPAAPVKTVAKSSRAPRKRRHVNEPVAIVGISGLMPQSADLESFWENLRDARDLVTVIPRDRWNWEEHYGDPHKEPNKSNSKWGGFISDVDKFDPLFFGISPREAQMMDPQQRLILEVVWQAVENAGQKVSDLSGTKTGVFVGVSGNDYIDVLRAQSLPIDGYAATGNVHSVLANRISFLLNLHGPSEPVDTACSSSLIALHRAVESIHSGNCEMAIVGGVQVNLVPGPFIAFGSAGMLSGDGKCKTFDKSANGYVRGEGAGALFLKPLSAAEADGNPIYAIVKSTAENHGGRVSTLTAPNSAAQSALLIEAYEKAEIDPATIGYIECHGTGTSLGDPIEAQALSSAFRELYARRNKVPAGAHIGLSSVKTNIGHLEAAAGVAGIFKVLLAMKHKQIPANIHFEELNPYINLEGTPFYIVDKLTPWETAAGQPRRAGISSFGFGGANAHVVLEEYVAPKQSKAVTDEPRLIVLSAKNADRLDAYVRAMHAELAKNEAGLAEVAYTLQAGRDEMPERLAFVAATGDELRRTFAELAAGNAPAGVVRGNARKKSRQADSTDEILVQAFLERRDLAKLAELWVSGAKIDWSTLYQPSLPKRIALPAYPFARERHWAGPQQPVIDVQRDAFALQSWAPSWKPFAQTTPATVDSSARIVLLGEDRVHLDWIRKSYPSAQLLRIDEIESAGAIDHVLWIAPDVDGGLHDELIEQQENGVLALLRAAKALLRSGHGSRGLQWTAITASTQRVTDDDLVHPAHAGVAGFMGSLAKEYPQWDVRLLDVDSLASVAARECLAQPADKQGNVIAHRRGAWFRQTLEQIPAPAADAPLYRRDGVYVVIGGAGGIGEVWTRHMIEQYDARVVWIGRRAVDASIENKLAALSEIGHAPLYVQADATDYASLQQAYETIRAAHPQIHGVVHSAVVLHDQGVSRMEEPAFRAAYAAKVAISVNMDRVFGSQELDFMLFFSSMVSFFKTPGLTSYAAGCTFKDSFAQRLQQERPWPVRIMNWGYWGSVGVAADEAQSRIMAQMGVGSIEPQEAMTALEAFVASNVPQILLIKMQQSEGTAAMGLQEAMAHHIAAKMRAGSRERTAQKPAAVIVEDSGRARVRQVILDKLAEVLRMEPQAIDTDAPFVDFGVDSIAGVALVRTLNETLEIELEPSKLFDYDTVELLSQYIADELVTAPQVIVTAPVAGDDRLPIARAESCDIEVTDEQVLENILWQEAALADDVEKVTF